MVQKFFKPASKPVLSTKKTFEVECAWCEHGY